MKDNKNRREKPLVKKTILLCSLVGFILLIPFSSEIGLTMPRTRMSAKWSSEFRPYGGYVVEIKFIIFTENEIPQAMLALQAGDIDAYDERVLEDNLIFLVNNPDIYVTFTPSV